MRTREEIERASAFPESKMIELLLDIRELMVKQGEKVKKKMGRPKKIRRTTC